MRDGMAPPDPLHLVVMVARSSPSPRASSYLLPVRAQDRLEELVTVPDLHRRPCRWMSTRRPARCLPQLISCHATEMTPLVVILREIQSSPERSPSSAEASAARPCPPAENRLAGEAISSAECGRSVLKLTTHRSSSSCALGRSSKTRPVRNSVRSVRWNRSILPVVVGRLGAVSRLVDAVLAADPVEHDLGVLGTEAASEHLAVVGQDLLGNAVTRHRLGEVRATRPCSLPAASARHRRRTGSDRRCRSRILASASSASSTPPTTSICHSSMGRDRSQRL